MAERRRLRWLAAAALAAAVAAAYILLWPLEPALTPTPASALPLAILGDSDSHAYQDRLSFADDPSARGGEYRATTLQWVEILARLRGDQVDPGPWGAWGQQRGWVARWRDRLGLASRFPRKEDYRYNFAISGAVCEQLMDGPRRQAPRLVRLMDEDPQRWQRGVVLIRIGTNNFGKLASLDRLSRDPADATSQAEIAGCVREIGRAVALLRERHPRTRIVIVGIFNNAHWERFHARWQTAQAQANIRAGLDRFDEALRAMAAARPGDVFFDDQAWFAQRWGSRGPDGRPAYRELRFGPRFVVRNTGGDDPSNATLKDGHAGTVWNALWAQSLVALMNASLGTAIRPLGEDELAAVADPQGRFGMR